MAGFRMSFDKFFRQASLVLAVIFALMGAELVIRLVSWGMNR